MTLGSSPQAGAALGSGFYSRFAIAEMEVYGRGFVRRRAGNRGS